MSSITEDILAMETQTWEALKKSGKDLLPFLTSDCLMLFPGGTIFSQESTPSISEILNRQDMKPWTRYEMDNVHVLSFGSEAASISYSVEAFRESQAYRALITSVWRKKDDTWQMCLHQQTPA